MPGVGALLVALVASASVSPPATAQTSGYLTPYVASVEGAGGDAVLIGAALATIAGPVGLRVGAGFDASRTPIGEWIHGGGDAAAPRVWGADLDGLLFVTGGPARTTVVPYLIGTVGVRGWQLDSGFDPRVHMGYGGGMRVNVSRGVALEFETRQHTEYDSGGAGEWRGGGLEYRAGLSFRLGGASPARAPAPRADRPPRTRPAAPASAVARRTIETGEAYLGTPYLWGGGTPGRGFDCSGFVQYVYRRNGIELPRVSRDQARSGLRLPADLSVLEPGDLMFFASSGYLIDHVAIYTGNGRILHSSASGGGVRYDDLRSGRGDWYVRHFVAARRVIDGGWFAASGPDS